jgi:hypothetical protein
MYFVRYGIAPITTVGGFAVKYRLGAGAAACLLLLATSCTTPKVTLPAPDASKTATARALVVRSDHSRSFDAPSGVVRGAAEGASKGVDHFMETVLTTGQGGLVLLGLAPILVPAYAGIGASLAHTAEEVDAAVAAFERVGRDKKLLASIDRRFVRALGAETAARWDCVAAASVEPEALCPGLTPVARIDLRPVLALRKRGDFDPDIDFFGDVVASVSVDHGGIDSTTDIVLEAKWAYREKLGTFFELTQDDAALLRRKLDAILDRFAARIAEDLYLNPRPEFDVRKRKALTPGRITGIPEGVVVRVDQGFDLASLATHATVFTYNETEHCWIEAIEGKPTGHGFRTQYRAVVVRAGLRRLDVSCVPDRNQISNMQQEPDYSEGPEPDRYTIEVSLEAGVTYMTDGRSYRRRHMDEENAGAVLAEKIGPYRSKSYAELKAMIDRFDDYEVPTPEGSLYHIQIQVFWDGEPDGNIRVMGGIDDSSSLRSPLVDDFVMAPDGSFLEGRDLEFRKMRTPRSCPLGLCKIF